MTISAEIIAALIGGLVVLAGQHFLRRKTDAEAGSINLDTIEKMGKALDRLETKVNNYRTENDELRARVDALEEALGNKENELRRVKQANEDFKAEVRRWVSAVMKFFKDNNITGYPEPSSKLLDTGEHKAVGK